MQQQQSKCKKIVGAVVILAVLVFFGAITWFVSLKLMEIGRAPEDVQEFFSSFGYVGWLVALGLQILQIFVAFIPGELIETGMGYAFGPLRGTLLCYAGLAIGQGLIFAIIRRFGVRAFEYFTSPDALDRFSFLKNETKLKKLIFVLFIIPGTPKDLLTYLAPLTRIKFSEFMIISLIARFPSIVSSTIGGNLLAQGEYISAAVLYGVTGALSLLGMYVYNKVLKKKEEHNALRKSL